jgi:hypothetical protein
MMAVSTTNIEVTKSCWNVHDGFDGVLVCEGDAFLFVGVEPCICYGLAKKRNVVQRWLGRCGIIAIHMCKTTYSEPSVTLPEFMELLKI